MTPETRKQTDPNASGRQTSRSYCGSVSDGVQGLGRRHVEEQRAGGLDDRGPPRGPARRRRAPPGGREPGLQRPARGEEDRAGEEGRRVRAGADEVDVAREGADEEARRAEREAERHPALAAHAGPGRRRLRRRAGASVVTGRLQRPRRRPASPERGDGHRDEPRRAEPVRAGAVGAQERDVAEPGAPQEPHELAGRVDVVRGPGPLEAPAGVLEDVVALQAALARAVVVRAASCARRRTPARPADGDALGRAATRRSCATRAPGARPAASARRRPASARAVSAGVR